MSNVIRWTVEESDQIEYDQAQIYRSATEAGTYAQLATQAITDNTYNDETGSTSSWYKIRFFNTTSLNASAFSVALQANTHEGFCSVLDIRDLTNLTASDVTDTEVFNLISKSTKQLNRDINTKVIRERVLQIDGVRKNEINNSNTTYYVRNWRNKFIADSNDSGSVTVSDINVVLRDSSTSTESSATVASIDSSLGQFTLETAPSNVTMYVTYEWSYRNPQTPDPLINLACAMLTSAYAYAKVNIGRAPSEKYGNIKIFRDMKSFDHYFKRYQALVNQINDRMIQIADPLISNMDIMDDNLSMGYGLSADPTSPSGTTY